MTQYFYNKLVRDRIPEIIAADGRRAETEVLDEWTFATALKEKLVEEAREVLEADDSMVVTELADLLEVVDTLLAHYGISRAKINALQSHRRETHGGFERRIRLRFVE